MLYDENSFMVFSYMKIRKGDVLDSWPISAYNLGTIRCLFASVQSQTIPSMSDKVLDTLKQLEQFKSLRELSMSMKLISMDGSGSYK